MPYTSMPASAAPTCRRALLALRALANRKKAKRMAQFFKTGEGQYGAGDRFLGISVPAIRQLTNKFSAMPLAECRQLLLSPYNDARLLALLVMVQQYRNGDERAQVAICRFYVRHRRRVNNWNLVDSSAPYILGAQLLKRKRSVLYQLTRSSSLWDRRIAVLATLMFIRHGDYADTLRIARLLLADKQDLIHKACGWMLREVGKRQRSRLEEFLTANHRLMPRTMLRYAIERLPARKRRAYLQR